MAEIPGLTLKEARDLVRTLIRDFGATSAVYGTGTGTVIVTTADGTALSNLQIDETINDVWMPRQLAKGGHQWTLSHEALFGGSAALTENDWNADISVSWQINELIHLFREGSETAQGIGVALEKLSPDEINALRQDSGTSGTPKYWAYEKGADHAVSGAPQRAHRLLWYPPADASSYWFSALVKLDPFRLVDDADRLYAGYIESWQVVRDTAMVLASVLSYDQDKIDALGRFIDQREAHVRAIREAWAA